MALADAGAMVRNENGIATVVSILKKRFGDNAQTGKSIREQHGHTTSYVPNQAPDLVVFAETTEDVQEVVRLCGEWQVPVIPFGTGTSLEGHVNAPAGGVSIDLSRMNRILKVYTEDLNVVVEPGITRKELNEYLRDTGLFFPIDPGAMPALAAWLPRAPRAPMPCATAPCAKTCWR